MVCEIIRGLITRGYLKSKRIYGTVKLENYKIIAHNRVDGASKMINFVQNYMKENVNNVLESEEGSFMCRDFGR